MSWMDEYYKTLAQHNMKQCDGDCRHCKREKDTNTRIATAIEDAKVLYGALKTTTISYVHADYNGGSDEGFVDYIDYLDKAKARIHCDELYKIAEMDEPWQSWSKLMEKIAWGILGYGFGTGDYFVSGTIVLDVVQGKLLHRNEEIASFKEAA